MVAIVLEVAMIILFGYFVEYETEQINLQQPNTTNSTKVDRFLELHSRE